jgi:hypothetical protein
MLQFLVTLVNLYLQSNAHTTTSKENFMLTQGYTTNESGQLNAYAIEPKMYVDAELKTGFTEYAERLNGRLAMIGFVALLVTELVSRAA